MHTPTIRRAGFLAASALGLALFGALTTSSAGASLPGCATASWLPTR